MTTVSLDDDAILSATRAVLSERAGDGGLTAKDVRHAVEERLGLQRDALLERREVVIAAIEKAVNESGAAESEVDPAALQATVAALEGNDAAATALVLIGRAAGAEAPAMLLAAESAAASESAARALVSEGLGSALLPLLSPSTPKQTAELALRLLSAASKHAAPDLSQRLLKDGVLPALLPLLALALGDAVAVRVAALLHALADSPSSRFRLLHGGAVRALTRAVVEPASSSSLKEYSVQATASVAGRPEDEVSLPQLLGDLCGERLPGTQREGLAALQIIAELQPGAAERLGGVGEVARGLRAAVGSADAAVAEAAASLRRVLKLGDD